MNVKIQFKKTLMRHNKVGLMISRGSAATYLKCGGHCCMGFIANFIFFSCGKRLAKTWPSYSKFNLACLFWDTVQ